MANYSKIYLTFILIFVSLMGFGQDRYVVKYKYKPNSTFNLNEPETFLTPKAIERREKERILPDSTDLPVSPKYIQQVKPLVKRVNYHLKWFNASVVVADEGQVADLEKLPFVKEVELIANKFHEQEISAQSSILKLPLKIKLKSNTEEDYALQNNLLGIPEMHQEGLTGNGLTIAVFDAGFLNTDKIDGMKHLFDNNQIITARDFVTPWSENVFRSETHGTSSLSLIAANDQNTLVSGAYDANYILCITEDVSSEFRVEEYNWARAAEYADSLGVDIINSSLGYNHFDDPAMNYSKEALDGKTAVISQAAFMAGEKGILVVSSVGNSGGNTNTTLTAPADAKGILAVGAVTLDLNRASFSSVGPTADGRIKPDLMALGDGVRLWRVQNGTSTASGTSFSAPQITALAAGIWQGRPHWTKDELIDYLLKSGSQAENPDSYFGYGIPDFFVAYQGEITGEEIVPEKFETVIYPNPTDGNQLYIKFGHMDTCDFTIYDTSGKVLAHNILYRSSNKIPYEASLTSFSSGVYIIQLSEGILRERHKLFIQ
ncbi:S8 family serine peptidase [Echinicola jeungdonensis]|uniref:S8 family serine peptidase n=1 Tax=Echinicola jeungdonensis TaxID=709343 RepID=A0ABV5J7D4_9BACT|nr:S8 family serine peptidase [Echinicola jeungdonensis]MDN3670871.1 S8 family serine peptidase [Echinicola jeungdonensis]